MHTPSAASTYHSYGLQIGAGMGHTLGGIDEWVFACKAIGNLIGTLKGPVIGSVNTELHIPSAASYYQSFALQLGIGM
eukprot:10705115-Karenia_brevis.AAC.1